MYLGLQQDLLIAAMISSTRTGAAASPQGCLEIYKCLSLLLQVPVSDGAKTPSSNLVPVHPVEQTENHTYAVFSDNPKVQKCWKESML